MTKNKKVREKKSLRLIDTKIRKKVTEGSDFLTIKIPYLEFVFAILIANLATMIGVVLLQSKLPPEIPLFYGLPSGTQQIANKQMLVIPSLVSISSLFINVFIIFITNNQFLKKVLVFTCLLITILSITTSVKIFLLVGNV